MQKSGKKEKIPLWMRLLGLEYAEEEEDEKKPQNKFLKALKITWKVIYHLRAVFMAIPVLIVAFRLAAYNAEHLPLMVGIDLQSTGEFARTISRKTAVTFPLMITGGCLCLTALSRKNFYPWVISIFSLVIPVLLLILNGYPA